jgi:hypothetical protein
MQYDITLFQFGRELECTCGHVIKESHIDIFKELEKVFTRLEDKRKAEKLKKLADNICRMILDHRTADVDIQIAINRLKDKCRHYFPDKMELFSMIYESRFKRLWEQFRNKPND